MKHVSRGFTLIELLVVVGIIGMLVAIAIPNFLSARQRAADTKKKEEMTQLKNALRLYYNDFNTYPLSFSGGLGKTNFIQGCGAAGIGTCPCSASGVTVDFASGVVCDSLYMKKFPADLGTGTYYFQADSGNDFCIGTVLSNISDPENTASQNRCRVNCSALASYNLKYWVCAD